MFSEDFTEMARHKSKTNTDRTVKTLLLCKINSRIADSKDLFEQVNSIHRGNFEDSDGNKTGAVFATIGKVDAISLYNTLDGRDDADWMNTIYQERKTIIQKSNSNISYHLIHLVANEQYTTDPSEQPCTVITLIYGINAKKAIAQSNGEFHSFEDVIKDFLKNKLHNNSHTKDEDFSKEYEIYNAINICDLVIINYTRDLERSLEIINDLSADGIARKSLSMICLPMQGNEKELFKKENYPLVNHFVNKNGLSLRIDGSIRNQSYFDQYKQELGEEIFPLKETRNKKFSERIVFGQSDFSLQFNNLDIDEVNRLFKRLFTKHDLMSKACWEAHTEFLYQPKTKTTRRSTPTPQDLINDPTRILFRLYAKYSDYSNNIVNYPALEKLSWYNAFYELLGVHTNIDADPVLHGPSYIVYRFAQILYHYLREYLKEAQKIEEKKKVQEETALEGEAYEEEYEEEDIPLECNPETKYSTIISKSEKHIEEAIEGWGNLTDQILRIDDLVFHGFGNSYSMYNMLAECALDFYHAMILRVMEFVYKRDIYHSVIKEKIEEKEFNDVIGDYCYDFLMLPNSGKTTRISELFDTKDVKSLLENPLKISNPEKQVYLVGFPIHDVYSPFNFFLRLVHECFHNFGHICRIRSIRTKYLCRFTAELILADYFPELENKIRKYARDEIILPNLQKVFEDKPEPNGEQSLELILEGIDNVFSKQTLFRLRTIAKHTPSLYSFERTEKMIHPKLLIYFFQEGYADLMMILMFRLTPEQYFNIFSHEEDQKHPSRLIVDAQRITAVSAVLRGWVKKWKEIKSEAEPSYDWNWIDSWKAQKVIKAMMTCFDSEEYKYMESAESADAKGEKTGRENQDDNERLITKEVEYNLFDYMKVHFKTLCKNDDKFVKESDRISRSALEQTICFRAMKEVMNYLNEVINTFIEYYETAIQDSKEGKKAEDWLNDWIEKAPSLENLREDFKQFFVEDQLFNTHFFEIIHSDHMNVKELVDKTNNNLFS